MYLRITQRHNRDGSSVTYYALAESVWNADAKRREAHVVHSFGRADQLDWAELEGASTASSMTVMTPPAVRRHLIVRRSRSSGCSNLVSCSPPAPSGKNSASARPSEGAPN